MIIERAAKLLKMHWEGKLQVFPYTERVLTEAAAIMSGHWSADDQTEDYHVAVFSDSRVNLITHNEEALRLELKLAIADEAVMQMKHFITEAA